MTLMLGQSRSCDVIEDLVADFQSHAGEFPFPEFPADVRPNSMMAERETFVVLIDRS